MSSRTYRTATATWTYVAPVLHFAQGSVTDAPTVIPTVAGYRVNAVARLG